MSRGVDIIMHIQIINIHVIMQDTKRRMQIARFEMWVENQRITFQDTSKIVFVFVTVDTLTSTTTRPYGYYNMMKKKRGIINEDRIKQAAV